ncbi:MAG: efflux RND transporter periplasmic adaptor subunit [Dysgonamonadaceae bacterium]|jgi:Cu(I)/Ag(I) efflux system membrane fusion protein|nr:efflux RND transporter periplasmic adaptor subunit [Dysgonamonadaceae bacterium]
MKSIFNIYVRYGLFLAAGLFLGWLFLSAPSSDQHDDTAQTHSEASQIWTCSMHPQIRQDKKGKCPICAMDLIPLKTGGGGSEAIDTDAIILSEEAAALANIQTTIVGRSNPKMELSLYGVIQANERTAHSLVSHINGRIEQLHVNFTGENVRKGQVLASVYSPDWLNAQQELLEAIKIGSAQPAILQAAREKLRSWKLTDTQIAAIEQSGKVSPFVDIIADASGVVIAKNVEEGDYINPGSILFKLADLSSVWAMFDAYEADLPYLKIGNKVEYTLQSLPGKTFRGNITFIDPVLDKTTRTARIRVETPNSGLQLKPEMYAHATVNAILQQSGHPIVIPKTAVLWTGKRSIVYLKQAHTNVLAFTLREIEIAATPGHSYIVLSGLSEGEEIVTSGAFTIDASAQLEGKRSMMNKPLKHADKHVDKHAVIRVAGSCDMCRERIETAAQHLAGVTSASWNSETNDLHLTFDADETSIDAVSQAIAKAGHDTEKYRADDAVYQALPECCKYRK